MSRVSVLFEQVVKTWFPTMDDDKRQQFTLEMAAIIEAHLRRLATEFATEEDWVQRSRLAEAGQARLHAQLTLASTDLLTWQRIARTAQMDLAAQRELYESVVPVMQAAMDLAKVVQDGGGMSAAADVARGVLVSAVETLKRNDDPSEIKD